MAFFHARCAVAPVRPAPGPRGDRVCAKIWFTYESVDGAPMGPAWGAPPPRPRSHLSPVSVLGIRSSVWVHRQSCCTPFYTVHTHTHTHTTKLTFYAKTNPSTHMPAPAYAKRSRCPAPKLRSNKTLPPAPPYCCCNIRRADCPTLSSSSAWKDRSSG